jgi:hypothetical protein
MSGGNAKESSSPQSTSSSAPPTQTPSGLAEMSPETRSQQDLPVQPENNILWFYRMGAGMEIKMKEAQRKQAVKTSGWSKLAQGGMTVNDLHGIDTRGKNGVAQANAIILKAVGIRVGDVINSPDYVKPDRNFKVVSVNTNSSVNLLALESGRMMNNVNLFNSMKNNRPNWSKAQRQPQLGATGSHVGWYKAAQGQGFPPNPGLTEMRHFLRGAIVMYRNPMEEYEITQKYVLLDGIEEIPDGKRLDMQELETGMPFPGITRADWDELVVVTPAGIVRGVLN